MNHGQRQRHGCMYHGCNRAATCLPRLYVPKSRLSINQDADDVSAMMGMPLCDTCFSKLTAKELLAGGSGEAIRAAVTDVFRQRNAFPNFDKAVIGRIAQQDHDFGRFEIMKEKSRAN
jgi:hypothetical protein